MAIASISGIDIKIGADLKDLKKEVGTVGDTIKNGVASGQEPVKSLKDNFSAAAQKAGELVKLLGPIATGLGKFTKGVLEDAVSLSPETAAAVESVKTSFSGIKTALAESIAPFIEKNADKITGLFDGIAGFLRDHPNAAGTIVSIASGVGLLSSAATIALPIMTMFGLSLSSINLTAVAVAVAIGGLALILGLLISRMDDVSTHAQATAESIETMDPATQTLVQNGYGELEIWDNSYTMVFNPETGQEEMGRFDEAAQSWVFDYQEIATASTEATDAITGQNEALSETSAAMEETTSMTDEVNQILTQMNDTIESVNQNSGTYTESMEQINALVESEAFQQFASQPINPEVGSSWEAFGESVSQASTAFNEMNTLLGSGGEGTEGAEGTGTGLNAAFDLLKTTINKTYAESKRLAEYWVSTFVPNAQTVANALAVTEVGEDGEVTAGGGNTLFNALGLIKVELEDMYTASVNLADHWIGPFQTSIWSLYGATGIGIKGVESMGTAVEGLTNQFVVLVGQIQAAIDTFLTYKKIAEGSSWGSGGGGNGQSSVLMRAEGGPVYAGSSYWVGEQGIELFTPHRSGYIIPNDEIGMQRETSIIINFEGDVIGDERSIRSMVSKAVKAGIRQEVRSGA